MHKTLLLTAMLILFSVSAQSFNPADLNSDCSVDINDLAFLADHWLSDNVVANIDSTNTVVDFSDFSILAQNWQSQCLMISEIAASNHSVIVDEDGDYPDWIELYNPYEQGTGLSGFYLTDDPLNLTKWGFPNIQIGPGQSLVVFSSGKDRAIAGSELHTNFDLDKDGEYLALVYLDGQTIVDEHSPVFPEQFQDTSYGRTQSITTLISPNDAAIYYVPSDDTWQDVWMQEGFDDSGWMVGQATVGFNVVASENIVGHWTFDSLNGGITPATVGTGATVVEAAGRAGQVITLENGLIGNALRFAPDINGTSGQYGGSVNAPVVIGGPGQSFTASCWVNPDNNYTTDVQTYARILHTQFWDNFYLGTYFTSGKYMWIVNQDWSVHSSSGMQSAGNWQLLTGTFDSATKESILYVNDVEITKSTLASDTTLFVGNMGIGNNAGSVDASEAFSGLIDDVLVYNRALTSEEIFYLYDNVISTGGVKDVMYGINASIWLRTEFEITDVDAFDVLMLKMKYEDGFAAYLNGELVASSNAPAPLQWNSSSLEDYYLVSENIIIPNAKSLLHIGTNVLAIHALNDDSSDGNFLLQPELITIKNDFDTLAYFDSPTPGQVNGDGFIGVVADTQFNIDRGFYSDPFGLVISTDTTDAQIYYTTDGSDPSPTGGTASLYGGPVPINATTVVRAAAFKDDYVPSNIDTHTYIFAADVPLQSNMWTGITQDPTWGPEMTDSLLAVPTVSLVTPNTISEVERETSVELLFPDGTDGFHCYAGIEHFGNASLLYPKRSMRISFKRQYGPTRLNYDLFGEDAAQKFDQILLRTGSHDTIFYTDFDTGSQGMYLRGRWAFDRQLEMGQPAPHGRFVHVYINGTYWGQHHLMERPRAAFMASYFGGDKEDYDVTNKGVAVDGDMDAWNAMEASVNNYTNLQQYMDVVNYADYMLLEFYGGNDWDWVAYFNWMAARKRETGAGYKFFAWDSDVTLHRSPDTDITNLGGPGDMWGSIRQHEEFQILLADRAQKYFFNNGMLTDGRVSADMDQLAAGIEKSIIAETARWGHAATSGCGGAWCGWADYTPDTWQNALDWVKNIFVPGRANTVIGQLRNIGVFPLIDAPSFSLNGGYVEIGEKVNLTAPTGTVYYTLDGSDPRLPGGAINPTANTTDSNVIIPVSSEWKYLDDGTDQATAWRELGFSDSGWSQGNAELGYGDSDEATVVGFIDVDPGTPGVQKNATTYFRKHFTVNNTASITSSQIRLLRDDGALVYLNGQELFRDNIAVGPIAYDTYADVAIEESIFHTHTIDPALLQEGDNVIAVEIHQHSNASSDISFDLELTVENDSSVTINNSTIIKARAYDSGQWSPLNEAVYAMPTVAQNLRISEIMYHPADPNTEFIELENISTTDDINVNLVSFTKGIEFTFGDTILTPGEYAVLVQNPVDFAAAYPGVSIAGTYSGRLDNDQDRVTLVDGIGTIIHNFMYKDGWYGLTDGGGFSLTIIDVNDTNLDKWDDKDGWRSSTAVGGSPGYDDGGMIPNPGDIVINELLAHSDTELYDWIELYNTTNEVINIGGWFLSDNNDDDPNRMKYEIAAGTTIKRNDYIVFYENLHFGNPADPGCNTPFALSENGETLYLQSGQGGVVTGYYEQEDFGASAADIAFGRYYKASTDTYNFVATSENTSGSENAYPKVGPIIINEIMYHPQTNADAEYIELLNIGSSAVTLYDSLTNEPWQFIDDAGDSTPGLEFHFPTGTPVTMAPGEYLLLVKNLIAFNSEFTPAGGVTVLEWTTGSLSNGGEEPQLSMPGDLKDGIRQYIRIDKVNYDDEGLWPTGPDGSGDSLTRKNSSQYGNDVANWQSATPSPGS